MDLGNEIRSFTPINIEEFSKNNVVTDKVVESIKAYNKAIEYLKTGSEDIAIIELKRVVAINPDFYEAVNLLGLCYAYTNQQDKAEELFGKVVQGENNVLKAADYLNYFTSGDSGSSKKNNKVNKNKIDRHTPDEPKKPSKKEGYKEDEVQAEYVLIKKIGTYMKKPQIAVALNAIGIICLVISLIFFVLTLKESKHVPKDSEPIASTATSDKLSKALADNNELQKQLDAANLKLKQIQLSSDISQVSALYNQGKYYDAANKLNSIPVKDLGSDLKNKYDTIKNGDVYRKAGLQLTNDGNSLYNSGKYAEAITKFENAVKLGDKWITDKTLYVLGKCYVLQGDNQKGAETYQKLINQFPKSSYVKYAKSRLESIQ